MTRGSYIADMIATTAMLDPILGGHRPMSAARSSATAGTCPAGTAGRPDKDPATIPDPATTAVPEALRREIEAHMALYPDTRSAALPALEAAQRVHGWCSPEAIEQVACVMGVTPASLDAVATFYDMLETEPVGSTACMCARTSPARCAAPTSCTRRYAQAAGEDRGVQRARVRVPRRMRHRADGLRRRRVRRSARDRRCPAAARRRARRARRCCPTSSSRAVRARTRGRRMIVRLSAPHARMRGRRPRAGAPGTGPTCADATQSHTRMFIRAVESMTKTLLFDRIDEPGLNTLEVYEAPRRLRARCARRLR